jgi:phosphoribosyl-AMP cyclohydrolase/phosphoribosyl-ATP pyrophosphohydrolase/phosphoribosyl-AMP cyclohydrolase
VSALNETIDGLTFNDAGLIPAFVIDAGTKQPLMMAWMNAEALRRSVQTGRTHFWSRSRGKFWMKGESSGHTQQIRAIYTDCDRDTLVVEVDQEGAACHEGYRTCFFRRLDADGRWEVVEEKVFDPRKVYSDDS